MNWEVNFELDIPLIICKVFEMISKNYRSSKISSIALKESLVNFWHVHSSHYNGKECKLNTQFMVDTITCIWISVFQGLTHIHTIHFMSFQHSNILKICKILINAEPKVPVYNFWRSLVMLLFVFRSGRFRKCNFKMQYMYIS